MHTSALVLFSGGQDSTTCLAHALSKYERVETLAFDYGQRHKVELDARLNVLAAIKARFPAWAPKMGEDHLLDVAVLGQVNRPGRYPLPTADARLSAVLADAGGIAVNGGELVVVNGQRQGKAIRHEVMADTLFTSADRSVDLRLQAGDLIYVARAPLFYVYGEVQRPGSFRLEPGMTVMQALATGGGQTARGSRSGLEIHRQQADGQVTVLPAEMHVKLQPNDVLYIPESLF